MAEAVPAVALLFDDEGLGEQLRSALQERGARIVHEGPLKSWNRELVFSVDADVLVVNLDDEDDEALDRLDESLDGDRPRVVFNDGQASRRLEGWDRARWARHLAMKVLAMGDADPPRPPAPAEMAVQASAAVAAEPEATSLELAGQGAAPEVDEEARQAAASETLAAELEALLASDVAVDSSDFDSGMHGHASNGIEAAGGDGAPGMLEALAAAEAMESDPSLDYMAAEGVEGEGEGEAVAPTLGSSDSASFDPGSFGTGSFDADRTEAPSEPEWARVSTETKAEVEVPLAGASAMSPEPALDDASLDAFQLDEIQLAAAGEAAIPTSSIRTLAEPSGEQRVSDSWTLFDHDASDTTTTERVDPAHFGIEKLSAADYLAPDVDDTGESPIMPGLSLELVSIEEAIAPQDFQRGHEMVLELPDSALSRLVVLGATTESTASVGEFLAALPAGLRATVLHTQHLAGRPADGLVEYFATQCALPVRLAETGMRTRVGEVIVVPSDHQVTLHRNGGAELKAIEEGATHAPSIDASFTQAAAVFGKDVIAIVFAGRSTDAVAGCQAVRDRGGQVWIEASGSAHAADMVSGVLAEHLSHHAGTPRELAARLVEQFSEGQP